jgi:hypothetical protein
MENTLFDIKDFIKNTLVHFYSKCTTDQYGQVSVNNFQDGFFGDRDKEKNKHSKKY